MKPLFPSRLILPAILLLCLLSIAVSKGNAEISDRVVAIVNDSVITLAELNDEGSYIFRQIREKVPPAEREAAMEQAKEDILTRLIDSSLIQQSAEEYGIEVDEKEIDNTLATILQRNNRTREEFLKDLEKIGSTEEDHRQTIRRQILESRIVGMEVRSKVVVTDNQIKEYYDNEFVKQDAPEGYTLLQIGLTWGPEARSAATREDAMELAKILRQKAVSGTDFKELAKSYSDMPSARDGGTIGSFLREELAPFMREAILSIKPGEVSSIINTENDIQFFKLLSVKEGDLVSQAPFDAVKEEIRETLYNRELETLYSNWTKQLREKAYIKKLL